MSASDCHKGSQVYEITNEEKVTMLFKVTKGISREIQAIMDIQ